MIKASLGGSRGIVEPPVIGSRSESKFHTLHALIENMNIDTAFQFSGARVRQVLCHAEPETYIVHVQVAPVKNAVFGGVAIPYLVVQAV